MRLSFALRSAALALALALIPATATVGHADPDALWRLISGQCVVDEVQFADPAPCAAVDLAEGVQRGHAVLKDSVGARQFLLIPTARIAGIESAELLAPDAPNYFADAWQARSFTEAAAGGTLPRDWISLAINSALARSQNQLHIHIDCLRADVHDALTRYGGRLGPGWTTFPVPLAGHTYTALPVDGPDLTVNPFRLVADALSVENPGRDAGGDMGSQTIVVVGTRRADGSAGFLILADRADGEGGSIAGGEQLQDHDSCAGAGQ